MLTTAITDINPNATDKQVLRAGHACVVGFAIFMAAFATMLHGVKIDLGFIYVSTPPWGLNLNVQDAEGFLYAVQNMTGIFTGSALPALVGTFFSTRQGPLAATASIWGGFFSAVITWVC